MLPYSSKRMKRIVVLIPQFSSAKRYYRSTKGLGLSLVEEQGKMG